MRCFDLKKSIARICVVVLLTVGVSAQDTDEMFPQGPRSDNGRTVTALTDYNTIVSAANSGIASGTWRWRTGNPIPISGQISADSDTAASITSILIHEITRDGLDVSAFLNAMNDGDTVFVQEKADSANFFSATVDTSVDSGAYQTWSVTIINSAGSFGNNDDVLVLIQLGTGQFVLNAGDTMTGTLNFSAVGDDITTPGAEDLRLHAGAGGDVLIGADDSTDDELVVHGQLTVATPDSFMGVNDIDVRAEPSNNADFTSIRIVHASDHIGFGVGDAPQFIGYRSFGTLDSPLTVSEDALGVFLSNVFYGDSFIQTAHIGAVVDGTITGDAIPTRWGFLVMDAAGVPGNAFQIRAEKFVYTDDTGLLKDDWLHIGAPGDFGVASITELQEGLAIVDPSGSTDDKTIWLDIESGQLVVKSLNDDSSDRLDNLLVVDLGARNIIIGDTTPHNANTGLTVFDATVGSMAIVTENDTFQSVFVLASSDASQGAKDDGDAVGIIIFKASDGTDNVSQVASITAVIDGTPGANDTPGELVLATTADGAAVPTDRVWLKATGRMGLGLATPENPLEVFTASAIGSLALLQLRTTHGDADASIRIRTEADQWTIGSDNSISGAFSIQRGSVLGASPHILMRAGSIVLNEAGGDIDFRVEGDTQVNGIVYNAGTDTFSINGSATTDDLNVGATSSYGDGDPDWTVSSHRRFKDLMGEIYVDISYDDFMSIRPYRYTYKADDGTSGTIRGVDVTKEHVGFLADEFNPLFSATPTSDFLNYSEVRMVQWAMTQKLIADIQILKITVASLVALLLGTGGFVQRTRSRLKALEDRVND